MAVPRRVVHGIGLSVTQTTKQMRPVDFVIQQYFHGFWECVRRLGKV